MSNINIMYECKITKKIISKLLKLQHLGIDIKHSIGFNFSESLKTIKNLDNKMLNENSKYNKPKYV